jgi:hypothetical protein
MLPVLKAHKLPLIEASLEAVIKASKNLSVSIMDSLQLVIAPNSVTTTMRILMSGLECPEFSEALSFVSHPN